LPASADKELSVRCLIYVSAFAANPQLSAEDRQLAPLMRGYWLGRVNTEFPKADVVQLLPEVAVRLKAENIRSEQQYCGSEMADHIADLERGEAQLEILEKAAVEAEKKSK
jgi:hypothetical protein